jgi:hypothetical protein
MSVQRQTGQWKDVEDMCKGREPNATQWDLLPSYGWTEAWFARVFLPWLPVRESRQEAAALRNFTRWERRRGGHPQKA